VRSAVGQEMRVRVDQARQQRGGAKVDHRRPRRCLRRDACRRPHRLNRTILHQDGRQRQDVAAAGVQQMVRPHEGRAGGPWGGHLRRDDKEGDRQQSSPTGEASPSG
jgi:hypothetical protein